MRFLLQAATAFAATAGYVAAQTPGSGQPQPKVQVINKSNYASNGAFRLHSLEFPLAGGFATAAAAQQTLKTLVWTREVYGDNGNDKSTITEIPIKYGIVLPDMTNSPPTAIPFTGQSIAFPPVPGSPFAGVLVRFNPQGQFGGWAPKILQAAAALNSTEDQVNLLKQQSNFLQPHFDIHFYYKSAQPSLISCSPGPAPPNCAAEELQAFSKPPSSPSLLPDNFLPSGLITAVPAIGAHAFAKDIPWTSELFQQQPAVGYSYFNGDVTSVSVLMHLGLLKKSMGTVAQPAPRAFYKLPAPSAFPGSSSVRFPNMWSIKHEADKNRFIIVLRTSTSLKSLN
ncbi:hypothetical protein GQ42DRAFT_156356 [Ramicandelaber brevisporus]|nr:hypothetical protein GQ42DRAFT_156356 [Ramicandelaber brevisporus]